MFYVVASLIISASYVAAQIFTGELGQAVSQFDTGAIINFLILLTAVMGIRALGSALNAVFLWRFDGKTEYKFRVNFARFFLRRPFVGLEKTNTGESLSIFTNELPQAGLLISNGILQMISDFMLLIIVVAYMFYMNWFYTLIFMVSFPVLALIQVVISAPIQKASKKATEARAGFNAVVNDSLQNTATVIAYSLEDELENRYIIAYKKYFEFNAKHIRLFSTLIVAGFIFSTLPLIYLFIASGFSVVNGTMAISDFIAFTGIGLMAAGWLMDLSQSLGGVRRWIAGAQKLNELLSGEEENIGEKKSLAINTEKPAVSFKNINFAYVEGAPNVLHDVSFEIPHGAKVAIVGGSGSGKSTILKLLLGLYEPKSGKINIHDNDTSKIGKYALRDSFAYVPQDSFLFPVSVSENITGKSRKELSANEEARLQRACRDAGILDFINSLPDKFNSILSESAENISGGQRQRIAMARAFYKDASIILFDEATSALDPSTEAGILKSLEEATRNKTVIMVAHRATAKAFCDTVITMEGGRVL